MIDSSIFDKLSQHGVVPVITIESAELALPLADTLLESGLPVAEITFRTAAAAQVIHELTDKCPDLLVGAGTVLTPENVRAAHDAGAQFGVAPGLNRQIVELAHEIGLPFLPGVATPSDIESGLSLGCRLLKLFPAGALGGMTMIKALAGPYRHTGVQFMPSGGVKADNMGSFLAAPEVAAVGGTWLVTAEDLAAGNWKEIRRRCRAAVESVKKVRGG